MSKENFVDWLLEDVNAIYAEKGSPRDKQLQEFADEGFLERVEDGAPDNAYIFTNKARMELINRSSIT